MLDGSRWCFVSRRIIRHMLGRDTTLRNRHPPDGTMPRTLFYLTFPRMGNPNGLDGKRRALCIAGLLAGAWTA